MNKFDENDPKLEQKCSRCTGRGKVRVEPCGVRSNPIIQCPICRGAGTLLTEKGHHLIGFMHRHSEATRPGFL